MTTWAQFPQIHIWMSISGTCLKLTIHVGPIMDQTWLLPVETGDASVGPGCWQLVLWGLWAARWGLHGLGLLQHLWSNWDVWNLEAGLPCWVPYCCSNHSHLNGFCGVAGHIVLLEGPLKLGSAVAMRMENTHINARIQGCYTRTGHSGEMISVIHVNSQWLIVVVVCSVVLWPNFLGLGESNSL